MVPSSNHGSQLESAAGLHPAARSKFWIVSLIGYWAIRLIGCTLRWRVEGSRHLQSIRDAKKNTIYTFWHGTIFMGTYFFRHRGIVVMTSQNRDGEYIARVIRRFGYGAARGSSTRGSLRALAQMIQVLRSGRDVALTIDGPRGPRYVAKPGAVWIASKTGDAIFPFHLTPERKWTLNSWDQFQIPKPFTRVFVDMGAPIYVRENAGGEELEQCQQALQRVLEGMLARGESYWREHP
jgi:lysophospholipid acyltransferase (LPLAT)-like uncharacterized protein